MSILYHPQNKSQRRVLLFSVAVTGIVLLIMLTWYFLDPRQVIGDALVNTPNGGPFEIPPPNLSPLFHVKPVTIFFAALVVFGYSSFSVLKERIGRIPSSLRTVLLMVSVLGLAVSVYEVLFNFTLWGVLMAQNANPDSAVNGYPGGFLQINLVFATKTFVALLFISFFAIDSLRTTLNRPDTRKEL